MVDGKENYYCDHGSEMVKSYSKQGDFVEPHYRNLK